MSRRDRCDASPELGVPLCGDPHEVDERGAGEVGNIEFQRAQMVDEPRPKLLLAGRRALLVLDRNRLAVDAPSAKPELRLDHAETQPAASAVERAIAAVLDRDDIEPLPHGVHRSEDGDVTPREDEDRRIQARR